MIKKQQDGALASIIGDAQRVRAEVLAFTEALSDNQLTWQPSPESWSVAQCFEHLRKFDRIYTRRIGEALDQATSVSKASYRPSFIGRLFLRGVSPARGIRMPAPGFVQPEPVPVADGRAAVMRFLDQQGEVVDLMRRAEAYDVNALTFPSPLSRFLRLTVGDGFAIIVRHEQRHLEQARQVLTAEGFPVDGNSAT